MVNWKFGTMGQPPVLPTGGTGSPIGGTGSPVGGTGSPIGGPIGGVGQGKVLAIRLWYS